MTNDTQQNALQSSSKTSVANLLTTSKGQREFALLMNLRMACLLAKDKELMTSLKVKARLKEIELYLYYNQPSPVFYQRYVSSYSEFSHGLLLSIDTQGKAQVMRVDTPPQNVVSFGGRHAANQ